VIDDRGRPLGGTSAASTKTPAHGKAPRGTLVASRPSNEKRPDAQLRDESEYEDYLERQAQHTDPAVRRRAEAVIEKRAKAATQ
jgi:hypothetical protein